MDAAYPYGYVPVKVHTRTIAGGTWHHSPSTRSLFDDVREGLTHGGRWAAAAHEAVVLLRVRAGAATGAHFYRDELGLDEAWREGDGTVAFELPGSSVRLMLDVPPDDHARWSSGPFSPRPSVRPRNVEDRLASFHRGAI
jgi:hypothetical protein